MKRLIIITLLFIISSAAAHAEIITYYNPDVDLASKIVSLNSQATGEIDIMMFSLTEPHIVKSLMEAIRRGVSVFIIVDRGQAQEKAMYKALGMLKNAGARIKVSPNPADYMHIKCVIYPELGINTSGSFNETTHANKSNYERLDIIQDEANTEQAKTRFLNLWNNPNFQEI